MDVKRERGVAIMKLANKYLNGALVILMACGLAGCATNNSTTTQRTHQTPSTQVVKDTHKKVNKQANKQVKEEAKNETPAPATANSTNEYAAVNTNEASAPSSSANAATNTTTVPATNPAPVISQPVSEPVETPVNQQVTVDLEHIAVWTDAQGQTHHVNWDGSDWITSKDSTTVQHADWYDALPDGATLYAYKDYQFTTQDSSQWIQQFDRAINQQ